LSERPRPAAVRGGWSSPGAARASRRELAPSGPNLPELSARALRPRERNPFDAGRAERRG
jgi:hypothetical protein